MTVPQTPGPPQPGLDWRTATRAELGDEIQRLREDADAVVAILRSEREHAEAQRDAALARITEIWAERERLRRNVTKTAIERDGAVRRLAEVAVERDAAETRVAELEAQRAALGEDEWREQVRVALNPWMPPFDTPHRAQRVVATIRPHIDAEPPAAKVMFGEKQCGASLRYRKAPDWYHNCDLPMDHTEMHLERAWFHDDQHQGRLPVVIRWGEWETTIVGGGGPPADPAGGAE